MKTPTCQAPSQVPGTWEGRLSGQAAALLVDPTDVDALAAALRRLLADPELQQELRVKGQAQAARFSWEWAAQQTLALYRACLDRTQPH